MSKMRKRKQKRVNAKLTPRQHVHEAIRQGNGKKITSYMLRYWQLQREEEIKTAKKVFKS